MTIHRIEPYEQRNNHRPMHAHRYIVQRRVDVAADDPFQNSFL